MTPATRNQTIGPFELGPDRPLLLIAGPCVLEDPETNSLIGRTLCEASNAAGINFIFKASFDKANRSSINSPRGPGLTDGLAELGRLSQELEAPLITDVHEPPQAAAVAEVADVLQIPAFLCRQTDLLVACAKAGKPVNVKKGQFMSPAEMGNVISKLADAGCSQIMLTERGTFFGYNRLVNDFIGLGDLMEMGRPVCFDVTHSTQLPGGEGVRSGGRPDRAALLARAAVAAGVDALFIECHPQPDRALSDAATMQPLDAVCELLPTLAAIRHAAQAAHLATD